ncbi:Isocitrate dehydrogenase [NAD] subunit, mitochondrial [Daphnia magna]|uniref:Isocitrate dehydrogenase [NAD] subunit, mitochondrial n=1 Tax=Daphnia magna TaxID=35525 RepID=A0A164ZYQ2_9CRUS|nr:Isocitrate dehydrogenase [NAD] subunit, mitochondrial [Daphnia magna]
MSTALLLRTLSGPLRNLGHLKAGSVWTITREAHNKSKSPLAQYGGRFTVTMLPGDGIGPEMMNYVKEVFRYAGVPVDFEEIHFDPNSESEVDFFDAITSIKRNGVAIKGNIETRENRPGQISRNVELRNELDLFAYIMNCKSFPGIQTRHKDIDIVLIRQNTEGEYAMLEHENAPGVVESLKIVTRANSERLARYAFDLAQKQGRKKVTTVHKANIMKVSDGLFLETCTEVAKEYPNIEHNNMIIDNCCMQMVAKPQQFDVMIMTNLYGNIVSNLACGLIGGPGLLSGRNMGPQYAVFEPGTRNTGQSIAGKNIANPIAMLNASVDLLDHLGLDYHAQMVGSAVNKTVNDDRIWTPDLHGQATSIDVVQNVIRNIQEQTKTKNWGGPRMGR